MQLTNHHLRFLTDKDNEFYLMYKSIDTVRLLETSLEMRYGGSGGSFNPPLHTLQLQMKTFCVYELTVPTLGEARSLLQSIETLSSTADLSTHFPFFYKPELMPPINPAVTGQTHLEQALLTGQWRISEANANFLLSASYPEQLIVPSNASDQTLMESAAFRRGGRCPILVYYHAPRDTALLIASETVSIVSSSIPTVTKSSSSSSSLSSNQHTSTSSNTPLPSAGANRCRADEFLLSTVLPDRYRGALLDLRADVPNRRSIVQTSQTEWDPLNYSRWRRIHRPLTLLDNLNRTFRRFIEVCVSPVNRNTSRPFKTASLTDSLNLFANSTFSSLPGLSKLNTDAGLANEDSVRDVFGDDDDPPLLAKPLSELSLSGNASSTASSESNSTLSALSSPPNPTSPSTATNVSLKIKRFGEWLSCVREVLATAVAGATALDARDGFAQQQLNQEQRLLAEKLRTQQSTTNAAGDVAVSIEEPKIRGSFVLIQGRGGRDRTLIVAALIQIMLDPVARTFSGFQLLIDRTWIGLGHPFSDRCNNGAFGTRTPRNEGPFFILFLDCVRQLWCQYPHEFEFTDELLALLARHAYFSEFGTFIGNSMLDRRRLQVDSKTTSLWSYIKQSDVIVLYQNPLYVTLDASNSKNRADNYACWPCLSSQALEIWQELYHKQAVIEPDNIWIRTRRINSLIAHQFETERLEVLRLKSILSSLQMEAQERDLLPLADASLPQELTTQ